jgi:hypothetical protein
MHCLLIKLYKILKIQNYFSFIYIYIYIDFFFFLNIVKNKKKKKKFLNFYPLTLI